MYVLHLQEHNIQRKTVLLESKIINCKNIILHTLLYIRTYICMYVCTLYIRTCNKNYKILICLINSEWSMIALAFMNACAFNLTTKSIWHFKSEHISFKIVVEYMYILTYCKFNLIICYLKWSSGR